jgi:uncharacterized membrane protein
MRAEHSRTRADSGILLENRIHIAAPIEVVFELARRVEDWPNILPHYRSVIVRATKPDGRIVAMSAVRPPVIVPVHWKAVQRAETEAGRVRYRHIGGVTRGMEVEWRLVPVAAGVDVTIVHRFAPAWPWPGPAIARWIVCGYFVHAIAERTLAGIKSAAELGGQAPPIVSRGIAE